MKKLKQFFYLLYVLFFCFGGFIALNYEDIVLKWDWDPIETWAGLLRFVLQLGAAGLILFFLEIIIENIVILKLKSRIKSLESEVLELKGKLYDRNESQNLTIENAAGDDEEEKEED